MEVPPESSGPASLTITAQLRGLGAVSGTWNVELGADELAPRAVP
ncbi:MAG: hypothetical protein ACOCZK_04020 [Planctomycetota bacterium]